MNCPLAVTRSACYFALRVLLPGDVPANAGTYAPLEHPRARGQPRQRAAAGGGGGRERGDQPAHRRHGAARAGVGSTPRCPAEGQGTMNNLVIGGPGWTYYETIGGGQGASSRGPGPSGVHVGMSNTLNTPIEALELEYPLRVERYELLSRQRRRGRAPRRRRRRPRGAHARGRLAVAAHRPPPPRAAGPRGRRGRAVPARTCSTASRCRRRPRGRSPRGGRRGAHARRRRLGTAELTARSR